MGWNNIITIFVWTLYSSELQAHENIIVLDLTSIGFMHVDISGQEAVNTNIACCTHVSVQMYNCVRVYVITTQTSNCTRVQAYWGRKCCKTECFL